MRVDRVEAKIKRIEGFDVRFRHPDGRDIRSDMDVPSNFDYRNRAYDDWTVSKWIDTRFAPNYTGYEVEVLDSNGDPVHGRTELSSVRATFP